MDGCVARVSFTRPYTGHQMYMSSTMIDNFTSIEPVRVTNISLNVGGIKSINPSLYDHIIYIVVLVCLAFIKIIGWS